MRRGCRGAAGRRGAAQGQQRGFRPQGLAIPPQHMPPLEGDAAFDREVNDYYRLRLNKRFWAKDLAGRYLPPEEKERRRASVYARQMRLDGVMQWSAMRRDDAARQNGYAAERQLCGGARWEDADEWRGDCRSRGWVFEKGDRVLATSGPMRNAVATVLGERDGLLWYCYDTEGVPMPTANVRWEHGWRKLGNCIAHKPAAAEQESAGPDAGGLAGVAPEAPAAAAPEAPTAAAPEAPTAAAPEAPTAAAPEAPTEAPPPAPAAAAEAPATDPETPTETAPEAPAAAAPEAPPEAAPEAPAEGAPAGGGSAAAAAADPQQGDPSPAPQSEPPAAAEAAPEAPQSDAEPAATEAPQGSSAAGGAQPAEAATGATEAPQGGPAAEPPGAALEGAEAAPAASEAAPEAPALGGDSGGGPTPSPPAAPDQSGGGPAADAQPANVEQGGAADPSAGPQGSAPAPDGAPAAAPAPPPPARD
eukprot:TRINITY_DN6411_c0_g1_i5.p2 TRINITY_DN6411_c0_g1~~TRINITY_DN6411_c0_g1_i5.p2  ORF type:complete len:475 (+),score=141.37 TRINITY_DN6411_c0_g1_i5:194-1618(+)